MKLTPFDVVVQSQIIHPDWTPEEHIDYMLENHEFQVTPSLSDVASWMQNNIDTGRIQRINAQSIVAARSSQLQEAIKASHVRVNPIRMKSWDTGQFTFKDGETLIEVTVHAR